MVAISKVLVSPLEVWIDELAATADGSAVARWTLLSALESALEEHLTTFSAVVRLQVARPSHPDQRCAHGMYRAQLCLREGVPAHSGPWQHDSAVSGYVLMYGVLGDLVGCLRSALVSRPITPGTQFYWRTARGTYATVSVPAALGGATVAAARLSPVDVAPMDHPHRTSRDAVSMQSSSAVASIDGDPSASLLSSPDGTGLTTSVDAAPADHHVDVSPATPHAIGSDGSAPIASAWDDEGALLRAIASEHSSFSTASALLQGDDDPTDVRPPLASKSATFAPADSRFASLAPLSPDSGAPRAAGAGPSQPRLAALG